MSFSNVLLATYTHVRSITTCEVFGESGSDTLRTCRSVLAKSASIIPERSAMTKFRGAPRDVIERVRYAVSYCHKVFDSGLEGARSGREAILMGKALIPSLGVVVRDTWKTTALGVCTGVLSSCPRKRTKSIGKMLSFGLVGGAVGFGGAVVWHNRHLAASVARGALQGASNARDALWLERNPIDYA